MTKKIWCLVFTWLVSISVYNLIRYESCRFEYVLSDIGFGLSGLLGLAPLLTAILAFFFGKVVDF